MTWIILAYLIGVVWGGYILKAKYNMSVMWSWTSWIIVFIHYSITDEEDTSVK